jgi:hypothetical protein
MLQQWSSGHLGLRVGHDRTPVEEEPFVPVDPFKLHYDFPFCCHPHTHIHDLETREGSVISGALDCDDLIPTKSVKNAPFFLLLIVFLIKFTSASCFIFLLCIFSRVSRIFEDTEVSKQEIEGTGPGMISTRAGNSVLPTTGT